ncbi:uncharacterized protein BYT42DRAFT_569868 [Radiomyces spectabilis]|uniref:uncharacterized protein n=1 Tax=Radiomyces spectabilis TaxID=64574 RepID=UPI00221FD91D|nr:uncharacterized protein BYT42DRAFT_569868 [Radiomyces spectabilis]KAI8379740.1 hypothetical protein BYT42DRAFT_569868 [Radiomyces spectabilis]
MVKEQQRKIIAVDLDQTLARTLEALAEWHNAVYDTDLSVHDFHTYDFSQVWGGSKEEQYDKIRKFYESDQFHRILPIDDFALEALKMLKRRRFQLIIVTSRQQFIAEQTKKFVDRHYPGLFESIYFCNSELTVAEQVEYISKPKSAICQEVGVDVLIDDSLEHALDCASLGIEVLLYDRKGEYRWNHPTVTKPSGRPTLTSTSRHLYHKPITALPANVKRVTSWKQIIELFPKPTSPLRHCSYPEDFQAEENEKDSADEDEDMGKGREILLDHRMTSGMNQRCYTYETIELDELTDEDDAEEDHDMEREDYINSKKRYDDDASWSNDSMVWV